MGIIDDLIDDLINDSVEETSDENNAGTVSKRSDYPKTPTDVLSDRSTLRSYQINLIKDVTPIIVKYESSKNFDEIRKEIQTNGKSIIPYMRSWKSWEEFIDLAFRDSPPNKISLIIEFERIKNKLGHLPSKLEFYELSKFGINRYVEEFESWENLMNLLRYDNEYRNNLNIQSMGYPSSVTSNAGEISSGMLGTQIDNHMFKETIKKIDETRMLIQDTCIERDRNNPANDYSYKEIFQLLEKYLNLLPRNSNYTSIADFL